jgi:hypothetical protein
MARIAITEGAKFGRLTAVRDTGERRYGRVSLWLFRCDCGQLKILTPYNVAHGATRSCGCLRAEQLSARVRKHGAGLCNPSPALRRTYNSWAAMGTRCRNPKRREWKDYGGRGITICRRWIGRQGFQHFLEDMGLRPEGKTLDRIDVNGNYEPGNCRWAGPDVQSANRRPWGHAALEAENFELAIP